MLIRESVFRVGTTMRGIAALFLVLVSPISWSGSVTDNGDGTATLVGVVTDLLTLEGAFGDCMVQIDGGTTSPHTVLGCNAGWVSLGCNAQVLKKSTAQNLYTAAQLSFVTGNRVGLTVSSDASHLSTTNNYCLGYKIQNVNAP